MNGITCPRQPLVKIKKFKDRGVYDFHEADTPHFQGACVHQCPAPKETARVGNHFRIGLVAQTVLY